MENFLKKYLEERFQESTRNQPEGRLPFITISREFGCPSKLIAKLLEEALNKHGTPKRKGPSWRYISKEVVMAAAKELDVSPSKIQYLFNAEKKGVMDDIFSSFSEQYKSDRKIKKTIQEVIKSFARQGNIILVGRGGVAITREYTNGLHVRLQAPLEWRVQGICHRLGISEDEGVRMVTEMDKKRIGLIEIFLGKKFDSSMFDLTFNCQTFDPDEIVAGIMHMMEVREMI